MNVANTNAQLHPTPPLPAALNRVLEVINANDDNVLVQLSVLSDDRLINDTHLHLALLNQPDTLIRLLELEDLYVQFAAYKLAKAIFLNTNIYSFNNATSQLSSLQNNCQQIIRILVQKLVHVDQDCSGTGRAILELFHGLLKDHRNLVRNLDQQDHDGDQLSSSSSLAEEEEEKARAVVVISRHAAVAIVQELRRSEFWEATVLDRILSFREMQYAALVLFIDLQKARVSVVDVNGVSDEFRDSVMVCHKNFVRYMDKWMSSNRIGFLQLKKYLELICISMKPSLYISPGHHRQQSEVGSVDDREDDNRRPLEVLTALSPIIQDVLQAFRELDPELDEFSSGRTTFILPDNRNIPVHDYTPTETSATTRTRTKAFLSNPEAVRQLGRISLTATLSILDTLASTSSSDLSDGNSDSNYYNQIMELTSNHLIPFLEEWVGERTLPLLLTVYGEDDAGVSWLLKTMSRIYRRILDSLPPPSSHHHHHQQQQQQVDKIHNLLLESHVHPLEALFYFLETIGFDYQTLLDLLLTLDDPNESGGMLAAVMAILRSFTEDASDQARLLQRWRQEILDDQQLQPQQLQQSHDLHGEDSDTNSDYNEIQQQQQPRLEVLSNVYDCLNQLSIQILRLYKSNLFPYNPRPLLHVLELTKDILSTVLNDS
ncbi:hypothetical protein BGZ96_009536 [Linnemannia gamsii]|uniref:Protein Lines C-terminal domain-containing protein n=1 Tax=Linnemannia gamsii TaxID=64522 RepID=A0ABQ7JY20_9FUNG|nr:hypothetical protein BGZ96_009536 [Linnemannia gamsii]